MNTFPDESAYPIVISQDDFAAGLTKREYFAAKALQGVVANPLAFDRIGHTDKIEWAVKLADALIEALNQKPNA